MNLCVFFFWGGAFTTGQAAQRAPQKTTGLPLAWSFIFRRGACWLGWVGSVPFYGDKLLSTDQLCGQGNQGLVPLADMGKQAPGHGEPMHDIAWLPHRRTKASLIKNSLPRSLCMAWLGDLGYRQRGTPT
jgi:hypothetical protein